MAMQLTIYCILVVIKISYFSLNFQETFKLRDVTEDVKAIIRCVKDLTSGRNSDFTLIHFVEMFKGI